MTRRPSGSATEPLVNETWQKRLVESGGNDIRLISRAARYADYDPAEWLRLLQERGETRWPDVDSVPFIDGVNTYDSTHAGSLGSSVQGAQEVFHLSALEIEFSQNLMPGLTFGEDTTEHHDCGAVTGNLVLTNVGQKVRLSRAGLAR